MTVRTALTLLSLLLSIAIGLSIARKGPAISSRARDDARPLIGLSLGTLAEERWQRDKDLFVARAKELGADVLVLSSNSNGMRQIQDIQALLSRGVDVLVIVAFDPAAMAKAVATARDAGVPVICYDRMITDCNVDLYMSFDNFEVGRMQAQYLVDALADREVKRIVRINGPKTDHTAKLFRAGQDSVLQPLIEAGKVELIRDDFADGWRPAEAKKIVAAAITDFGPELDGILATNDGCAGGAIQVLIEEGIDGKVVVTGQDADLAACQRILRGQQSMTVYKPLHKLAGRAAETAVQLATGQVIVAPSTVDNGFARFPAFWRTP